MGICCSTKVKKLIRSRKISVEFGKSSHSVHMESNMPPTIKQTPMIAENPPEEEPLPRKLSRVKSVSFNLDPDYISEEEVRSSEVRKSPQLEAVSPGFPSESLSSYDSEPLLLRDKPSARSSLSSVQSSKHSDFLSENSFIYSTSSLKHSDKRRNSHHRKSNSSRRASEKSPEKSDDNAEYSGRSLEVSDKTSEATEKSSDLSDYRKNFQIEQVLYKTEAFYYSSTAKSVFTAQKLQDTKNIPIENTPAMNSHNSEQEDPDEVSEDGITSLVRSLEQSAPISKEVKNLSESSTQLQSYRQNTYQNFPARSYIIHTSKIKKIYLDDGTFKINQYRLVRKFEDYMLGSAFYAEGEDRTPFIINVFKTDVLRRKLIGHGKTALSCVKAEIELLSKLNHPHIQKLIEVVESPAHSKLYLVKEFADREQIAKLVPVTELQAWELFNQLISAVDYLHNIAVLTHGSVLPSSLAVDWYGNLKLTEFGMSVPIVNGRDEAHATSLPSYRAPELSARKTYRGRPVDVWGCGVCLYYFLTGKLFKGRLEAEFDQELKSLIAAMLQDKPDHRIHLENVKVHPWVARNC